MCIKLAKQLVVEKGKRRSYNYEIESMYRVSTEF